MKNLKRVLSLALATVMVIGMMVVGANATFADQSDIDYTEAVDMLTGLGVLNGMGDNKFVPNGTVTRAQAAKMVAYVKAGANETTVGYYAGATKFTDVTANHSWAAGSINYCVSLGIINGRSATAYDPDGNVTGAELAKMMLVALGYSATTDDATTTLTGANWQLNAIRMATETGLFNGMNSSFVATKAATRQEAAQIVYNALNAKTWGINGKDTNGNYTYGKTADTLLESCFAVKKVTGIVTANAATGAIGTVVTPSTGAAVTFKAETGLDMIGHSVTVLAKTVSNEEDAALVGDKANSSLKLSYGIIDNATKVATTVSTGSNKMDDDAKAAGFSKIAGTASDYTNAGVAVYDNYVMGTASASSYAANKTVIMISNSENKAVDIVIAVAQDMVKVTNVTTAKNNDGETVTTYTLDNGNAVTVGKADDTVAQAGTVTGTVAKDDFVIRTQVGSLMNLEAAKKVTATITSTVTNNKGEVSYMVGNTAYAASTTVTKTSSALTTVNTTNLKAGTEAVLYLDAAGKIVGVTNVDAVINTAYVAKVVSLSNGFDENGFPITGTQLKALVYFADGTNKVLTVNTTASVSGISESTTGLYNVVLDKDGKAVITSAGTATTAGDVTSITKGVSKVGNIYANNNTVVFFVTGNYGDTTAPLTVKVVKGIANIPTGTNVTAGVKDTTGAVAVLTAALAGAYDEGQTPDLVYYNGEYTTTAAEKTTVTYTVYKNGEKTTVSYTDTTVTPVTTAGFYVLGKDNLASKGSAKVVEGVTTTALYEGTLTAGGKDYQIGSAKIVDLTPANQTYNALVETGKTVTVSIAYTEDTATHVMTATAIYVTAVA